MRLFAVQSGSSGNALVVEPNGVRLVFDAGVSGVVASERLARHGLSLDGADALFISHEHSDHVRCAGVYARKYGIPIHITPKTFKVSARRFELGRLDDVRHFRAGDSIKVKHLTVHTVPTPHDAVDGSVFVIDDGRSKLGICTDVGHVYQELKDLVCRVDALYLESNYDEQMLFSGHYHRHLKERIAGPGGHISNRDAAELVAKHATSRLKWLCLAHLSAENNAPDIALNAHREALGQALPIAVASRCDISGPFEIQGASDTDVVPWPRVVTFRQPELDFSAGWISSS